MKINLKRKEIRSFFRAFFITLVSILCVGGMYLGFCKSYEAIRKICFDDNRGAVIIGEGYVKFFDFEINQGFIRVDLPAADG